MKIRILTQNPFSVGFGGVEQQATKYIENIRKKDTSIDICFFDWTEQDFDILHIVGIHTGINPYWIEVLQKKGVKIVVSSVFYLLPNSLFDFRRPSIYRCFSHIPHHIVAWMRYLIQHADLILPNSYAEQKQLQYVFGAKKEHIKILYNGVDETFFENIDPNIFSTKYAVSNYVLSVSHIEPRKNHLKLIQGFLQYKKESNSPLKLVLLGDYRGNYFSYHQKIRDILGNNLQDILHISDLKSTDSIFRSAYLGAKAHILLSSLETPGLSNIEAAYAGLPLILGDCEPVREYFGEGARYIKAAHTEDIISELQFLEKNPDTHSQERKKQIQQSFTWEALTDKLLEQYHTLCSK